MSSGNSAPSIPNANDEYGQVPLHEPSQDAAEMKKAAATAPPAGIMNHPGTSITIPLMSNFVRTTYVVSLPLLPLLSSSRPILLLGVHHDDRHK